MNDRKFSSAVRWSLAMNASIQAGNVLTTFVLASELGAEAFGIVALASFLVLLLELLVDPGLTSALVQRKDLRSDHLTAVFWVIVATSLVLMGACGVVADWWARYNGEKELASLVRVLAIAIPIRGLGLVQQAVLMRKMDFRSLALRTNAGIVIGVLVGVTMAFTGFGAWSIVGQQLALETVSLILIWRLSSWRPRFGFHLASFRELWGFSFGSFLQKLGNFCYSYAEVAVMGYFFSTRCVGLFRFSYRLVNVGTTAGTRAVSAASLPQFARQQDDPVRFRQSAIQSVHAATVITTALLVMLAANIDYLLPLLRTTWSEASVPLKILCLSGVAQVITMIGSTALHALGRSYTVACLSWLWGGVALATAASVAIWKRDASVLDQITTLAWSRAIVALLLHIPVYVAILRIACGVRLHDLISRMAPTAVAAAACMGTMTAVDATGLPSLLSAPSALLIAGFISGSVFLLVLVAFDQIVRESIATKLMRLRHRVLAADGCRQ